MEIPYRNKTKLIVGIDFGTTFSGISFALSNAADFKDIHPWMKYPGSSSHGGEHFEKAPSVVAFASENPELTENAWGYQVEPGMKSYSWIKLLLDNSALPTEYDDPELKKAAGSGILRLPQGMSAKDVVTEFLRGMNRMFEHAVAEITGNNKTIPVDFWLTVPATWSEKAKMLTKQAAMDAGFGTRPIDRIFLIPEPEAGAHLALKSSIHHVEDLILEGSGVLVCDCGGGTVDITTYEVERISPVLKTKESCVGIGGKCGGTFVDRNLYTLMSKRFGTAFTSLDPEQNGPGSQFMDTFEHKKRDFSMKNPSTKAIKIHLPMPALSSDSNLDQYYNRRLSYVLLSHDDMKSLFDPVVDMIVKLVDNQVAQVKRAKAAPIDTLVLIGGFGASPYLRERLQEWCAKSNIRLTTPWSGAWSAVVCGAVLRGLEGSIVPVKKCRRHYGHTLARLYDPAEHWNYDANKRRTWKHKWDGLTRLDGFMFWEINKGDLLDESTEISTEFAASWSEHFEGKHTHELFSCSLDDAPDTIENDRIEKVGEVEYTLDGLDMTKVKQTVDEDGIKWYSLDLTLNIRLGDEVGHMVFRILCRGREIGKAELGLATA